MRVAFSQPVAGVQANEPILVSPETRPILEQAARMGLAPHRVWDIGTTRHVPAHSRGKHAWAPIR